MLHGLSWHDTATTNSNTPNMDTKILAAVILHENLMIVILVEQKQ